MKRILLVPGLLGGALLLCGQNPWVYRGSPKWDRSWNERPLPGVGACFLKDVGDNISSIQLFGRARVTVFNDRSFRGGSQEFGTGISDLRTQKFRDGHTWNDRISSMRVH
jgi:hypothetical protein